MFHDRMLAGTALSRRPSGLIVPRRVRGVRTNDEFITFDSQTVDSTGAFLVGQLEKLDPTLHMPLMEFSWSRDMDLRSDVSIADETTSFTVSSFGASGGAAGGTTPSKSWVGSNTTALPSVSTDKAKVPTPMTPWGVEASYTIFELEASMKLGTSIDVEKVEAAHKRHQADVDAQVYVGDSTLGLYGLTNLNLRSDSSQVTNVTNVAAGTGGAVKWIGTAKTPDDILTDFNEILMSRYTAMGFVLEDTRMLLPTQQYGYIATAKVSSAGNNSILTYILENNFITKSGRTLEIFPSKWCNGRGVGGTPETLGTTDRMISYSKRPDRIRFPMVPLQRLPIQFRSLWQIVPFYSKLGGVECVYPEAVAYRDGM